MAVPSLNDRALTLVDQLIRQLPELGGEAHRVATARVIDVGVKHVGSLEAGLLVARICLADLGVAKLVPGRVGPVANPSVVVMVNHPVAGCMASQYAGWQLKGEGYFGMGSGPMRALYGKEALFDDIGMREHSKVAIGVLEAGKLPTEEIVHQIADACHVHPIRVSLVCARTASLVGGVQVAARSVETALHKLHALGFDLHRVVAGFGSAPLPPVAKDDMAAIGRTNDAVLYGGEVTLYVRGDDDSLAQAASKLPASASSDYGRPFGEVFKHYGYDFYKIDPMLFSPAQVVLQNIETGRSHIAGEVNHEVLFESFFK